MRGSAARMRTGLTARTAREPKAEWRASLFAKADYPETHLAIGAAILVLAQPPCGRSGQNVNNLMRLHT